MVQTVWFLPSLLLTLLVAGARGDDVVQITDRSQLRGSSAVDVVDLPWEVHRDLIEKCPPNQKLKSDSIWYTIELDVFSVFELKCTEPEWTDVRLFLEKELDELDLFNDFQIYELNARLCDSPESTVGRRKLVLRDTADPSVPDTIIDETDERFLQYLGSGEEGHRDLGLTLFIWYDLFFKGGSR